MIDLPDPPTLRELEVLGLVATGHSNQEIAEQMVVSINTVRAHLRNLYAKLNARNRIHAVEMARQLGLL